MNTTLLYWEAVQLYCNLITLAERQAKLRGRLLPVIKKARVRAMRRRAVAYAGIDEGHSL